MHVLILISFCWVIFLQVYNLVKYRETNGAMRHRLILMAICVCLTAHTVKRFGDDDAMFFLFLTGLGFVWLYHGFSFKKALQKKEAQNNPPG